MSSYTTAKVEMVAAGTLGWMIYKWLKGKTSRPRPCARNRAIHAAVAPLDEYSFPSGHTLHALGFSIVAIYHYPLLAWLLAPFALLVALSRLVLGLHYPSDVLAGAAIGTALAILVLQF
jgi:undecaprenyl-diphosphatase